MITQQIRNLVQVSLLLCSTLCAQTWSWQKAAAADGESKIVASMASSPQSKKCLVAGPGRLHIWTGNAWSFVGGFTTHQSDCGSVVYDEVRQCWIHSLPYVGTGSDVTRCIDANGVVTGAADRRPQGGPLAYDAARSQIVGTHFGYTMLLGSRDTAWRKVQIPGPRGLFDDAAMCYYPPTKTVFWQGGNQGRGSPETWEWNGQSWRKVTTQRKPGPRLSGWLVFEPTSKLLFYGGGWSGVDLHDLWTFDGIEWKQLTVVCPSDRMLTAAAYDYATQRIIAFDGLRIWRLYQGQPATVEAFELPKFVCNGSPRLNAVANSLPQLGTRFDTRTDSVPRGSAAIFMLGAVQPQNGFIVLLHTGNPFCLVLVSPTHFAASIEQNGFANYSLAIPNDASLLCQRFYQQALVIDQNANALGLVTSNGLSCHIGL